MCHEADIYNHAAIDGDFEGAQMDIYGNPSGSGFDLARDGAFEGFKILVLCAYLGEGCPDALKTLAVPELSRKGFAVKICTTVDDFTQELRQHLYHVAWIISGNSFEGDQEAFLSEVKKFHEFGRGLMIWGDNSPYFVHANVVLRSCSNLSSRATHLEARNFSQVIPRNLASSVGIQNCVQES